VRSGRAGQHQDQENLLGGVGDGGERIRREDRERDALGEPLVSRLRQRHRRPDEPALQQRQSHTPSMLRRMRMAGARAPDFYVIFTSPAGVLTSA
jgi:hypothetical protein